MKTKRLQLFIVLLFIALTNRVSAQGTAFTYQGQLKNSGSAANGIYNLSFSLFNTNANGVSIAGPVIANGIVVSNGLFIVPIDFGSGVFNGATNWLEIDVETNGAGSFTTLAPRQQLTPTPYAIFANTASNLSGTISVGQLTGTILQQQLPNNVLTDGESGVNLSGAFSGDGYGLTNTITTANYVSAVCTASQTLSAANGFKNIPFDMVNSPWWTYFGGSSDTFTCQQAGTYLIQYDAEVQATISGGTTITLRALNYSAGAEILGSEASIDLPGQNQPTMVSKSFLAVCTVGELLQFQFSANNTSGQLVAGIGAGAQKPSISCTIVRIQ